MKKKLIIGINTLFRSIPGGTSFEYSVDHYYVDAILEAGGVPLMIPTMDQYEYIDTFLDRVDGMIFIGGQKFSPAVCTEKPMSHFQTGRMRPDFELKLMKETIRREVPVLGICGGCQLLSLASGGRLIKLPENGTTHENRDHTATIIENGWFSQISKIPLHKEFTVNSNHRLAIDPEHPGKELIVSAVAMDQTVEVIECPNPIIRLGVQFHPERMNDEKRNFFWHWLEMLA